MARSWITAILLGTVSFASLPETSFAQPPAAAQPPAVTQPLAVETSSPANLRFNFAGTDWRSVLEWFTEEANLSLQLDDVPMGTFSFADPSRGYSVAEALDVLNLSLMKRGYSVVRRGRLLQVIDLEAENAEKLISEIADLVAPDDLETRGSSDIVSSVFPLGSLSPEIARDELSQLVGPWGRVVVLEFARQVKVTETATKLIAIRDLLRTSASTETEVIELVLKHRKCR